MDAIVKDIIKADRKLPYRRIKSKGKSDKKRLS